MTGSTGGRDHLLSLFTEYDERLDELELLLTEYEKRFERQRAVIDAQRERIDELERQLADMSGGGVRIDRRTALKAGGMAGLLALGAGTVSADPQGHVGTEDQPLEMLYAGALDGPLTGGERVESLVGEGLLVDGGKLRTVASVATLAVDPIEIDDTHDDATFPVVVTVAETAAVETHNLTVELDVVHPNGTSVYEDSIDVAALRDEGVTVTFGADEGTDEVGPLAVADDSYVATVTVDATNAAPVLATESFGIDPAFAGGDGSTEPYEIATWHHFDNVRDFLDSTFALIDDLDRATEGYDQVASGSAHDGDGFEPIGMGGGPFEGNFDGNGHAIEGVVIDRLTESNVGVFAESTGTIGSVHLVDVDVRGFESVGGLVGTSDGFVVDCHVTGEVYGVGDSASIPGGAGGLAGDSSGSVTDSAATVAVTAGFIGGGLVGGNGGTVTGCVANGTVEGENELGGLVGLNSRSATIEESYATGNVAGEESVGGLIGWNDGGEVFRSFATGSVDGDGIVGGLVGAAVTEMIMSDCYATGAVTGGTDIGGLVGLASSGPGDDDRDVSESYASGPISGTTNVGGLVGRRRRFDVSGAYWDHENSPSLGAGDGVGDGGSDGVTGLETAEMQGSDLDGSLEADFDFDGIWETVSESDPDADADGYPVLQAIDRAAQLEVRE